MIDVFANHSLIIRIFEMGWGLVLDAGYAWQFNSIWYGGTSAPGEKSWEIANVFVLFPIRVAAAWGFLQMKRWGYQWLVISCWMGVFAWVGYCFNMTTYWEMRFSDVAWPVFGWWGYNIWYITPFIVLPYLYTTQDIGRKTAGRQGEPSTWTRAAPQEVDDTQLDPRSARACPARTTSCSRTFRGAAHGSSPLYW
jgi:hypothetical protein